jgi:hypothetical protein
MMARTGRRAAARAWNRDRVRGKVSAMGGAVLRGDWTRLRRRGDRVWIRHRPYELIWHTTHAFTVGEVRSMRIEPVRAERRRRRRIAGRGGGARVAEGAITRVTFEYGPDGRASVDLNETQAAVVAAFEDLVTSAGPASPQPISWRAEPEHPPLIDLAGEQCALWEGGDRLTPELTQEVEFKLDLGADPHDVGRWILSTLHDEKDEAPASSVAAEEWFDVQELPAVPRAPGSAAAIRKRKRRARHLLHRRTA